MKRALIAVLASATAALAVMLAVVLPAGASSSSMPASAVGVSTGYGAVQKTAVAADAPSVPGPGIGIASSKVPANAVGVTVHTGASPVALPARLRKQFGHAASSGCWDWAVWSTLTNSFGSLLAKYEDPDVYWCGNGSTITSRDAVHPEGFTYYLAWQYDGEISYSNVGGVGSTSWTHNTQGHFCYNIPLVGCAQNWYPANKTEAFGNGGFWFNGTWLRFG